MPPSKGALSILPKSNPVCLHVWEQRPDCHAFVCGNCGYTLTYFDLILPREGEHDAPDSRG